LFRISNALMRTKHAEQGDGEHAGAAGGPGPARKPAGTAAGGIGQPRSGAIAAFKTRTAGGSRRELADRTDGADTRHGTIPDLANEVSDPRGRRQVDPEHFPAQLFRPALTTFTFC